MAQDAFHYIRDAVSLGIRKDNLRITPFSISKTSQEKKGSRDADQDDIRGSTCLYSLKTSGPRFFEFIATCKR